MASSPTRPAAGDMAWFGLRTPTGSQRSSLDKLNGAVGAAGTGFLLCYLGAWRSHLVRQKFVLGSLPGEEVGTESQL